LPPGAFPYVPLNFDPSVFASNATANENIDCDMVFNTTNLTWEGCNDPAWVGMVTLADGSEAAIAVLNSLNIQSGFDIDVEGDRAGIIAVYGDATIAGSIMATPANGNNGPGEQPTACTNSGDGQNGGDFDGSGGGGGGGAFGTAAGNGGNGRTGAAGGMGGASNGDNTFSPLRRGCEGGSGGRNGGSEGEAGGAVQLSVSGTLTMTSGRISASGDGGRGGDASEGGGGGGSGGMVLIEANTIALTGGWITANGGSGGEGGSSSNSGADGRDGRTTSDSQVSTDDDRTSGGNGGDGAAGSGGATSGSNGGGSDVAGGGGGGGGVGRIGVRGHTACTTSTGNFSPNPVDLGMATCN
jgi:hypothetical protein